jgi:hypothetical protein
MNIPINCLRNVVCKSTVGKYCDRGGGKGRKERKKGGRETKAVRVPYLEVADKVEREFFYRIINISAFLAVVVHGLSGGYATRRLRGPVLLLQFFSFTAVIILFKFIIFFILLLIFTYVTTQSSYCVTFLCRFS